MEATMNITRTKGAVKRHLIRTASVWWAKVVDDPRDRRGRRWRFSTLMNALWVGALSARAHLRQIENLTERHWRRISDSTLYELLIKLPAEPLRLLLVAEVRRAWRAKELSKTLRFNVVAVDGKCIWSGRHEANEHCQRQQDKQYRMMVLRAQLVSGTCKPIIGQMPIAADAAEMSTFPDFLKQLLSDYGRTDMLDVISLDAGMASKYNAERIHKAKRAYLISLKNPQRELVSEAKRVLSRRRKPDAETAWERYQGRRIRRLLYRTTEMAGYHGWSHLKQVWRIRQETQHKSGKITVEERYYLTSLTPGQTPDAEPIDLVRAHWGIENCGNWTLDTQWGEDDSPWVSAAVEVVSMLRLLAYNVVMRLRTRALRTETNRMRTWRNLIDLVTDVVVGSGLSARSLFASEGTAAALS
jgi:predicted transposase YbfD/YdcC